MVSEMSKLVPIFTILTLFITTEVTSTEDIFMMQIGVTNLREQPVMESCAGADEKAQGESHSRTRRTTEFTDFSSSEAQAVLVNKHNELRSQVSPEASNMLFMEWDETLANMAQLWSDECNFDHGNPTTVTHDVFDPVGQNLFLGSGSSNNPPDAEGVVQAWYNEDQYYTYETRECQPTKVCGHYTQVVWADSYAVGCGITHCPTTDQGHTNAWIVTCNYGPAGNYPRHPFFSGTSCTECPSNAGQCYNNLCRDCPDDVTCECNRDCKNCGTLVESTCTCECPQGFIGLDCSVLCDNYDNRCGNGWFPAQCNNYDYVLEGCPKMCGVCVDPEPDFVCIDSTPCPCIRHIPQI